MLDVFLAEIKVMMKSVWCRLKKHKVSVMFLQAVFAGSFSCLDTSPELSRGRLTPSHPVASTNSSNQSPESPLEAPGWGEKEKSPSNIMSEFLYGLLLYTRDTHTHTHISTLLSVNAHRWGCHRHALTSQLNRERPGAARSSITRNPNTHENTPTRGASAVAGVSSPAC